MSKVLFAQHASTSLGASLWTISRWARTGELGSIQGGRRWLFSSKDLHALAKDGISATPGVSVKAR